VKQELFPEIADSGLRIDKYLSTVNEQLSRSYIQKLLKSGLVLVDGKPVKASYQVEEGEVISLDIPEAVEPEIEPEDMDLDILYEDKDVILINKPKGMVVHPAAGHYSHTLVNGLMYHCKDQLSGINGVMRPGIVHRIDMDTTGVIIACKNDMAHNSIAAQLKEHSITRRYQAIVHGVLKDDTGTIDAPIGRHPTDRKKMSINYNHGKNAVTHYKVLKRFRQYTHVECRLETGRTHQIRVHMKHIGHVLFNDERYGGHEILKGTHFSKYKQFVNNCFDTCPRQALHAMTLGFVHPVTGEEMYFTSELPDDMTRLIEKWRGYISNRELE
jgi:23S rRNA pseudouridine1911/1915/1917 synthase